jgi:chromate transporter
MPAFEVFLVFLRLGLTSFGGPIAHLGYFRREFVARRKWLDEREYADLVALCQFLPGPASSQVGMAIGYLRAGMPGAVAAWAAFTLPSAAALILFGITLSHFGTGISVHVLHGLKIVAVAVVAQALWSMGKSLCPDFPRAGIAVAGAVVASVLPGAAGQIAVIVLGAILGWLLIAPSADPLERPDSLYAGNPGRGKWSGPFFLGSLLALLIALPVLAEKTGSHALKMFAGFFRCGALVFGGGHVVLPLLQALVVPSGWVAQSRFLAGYGAAQAVPGPLFSFAAFLGSVSEGSPTGWWGGLFALVAIFLPAFLLIIGVLPYWGAMGRHPVLRRAMPGVNAAVVGLLLAAFIHPMWTSAILSPADFGLAAVCLLLLTYLKAPSWAVVIFAAVAAGLGGQGPDGQGPGGL